MTHKSIDALLASTMFLLFTMVTPHYEDIAKKIGFIDSASAQTVATIAPTSTLTTVPTANPVTGQIIDPTVPAYTPVTSCSNWVETSGGPQGGVYWENLRDFNKHPQIDQYAIQWFNGNWSPWYTPTIADLDSKRNDNGAWRYMVSYLQDHNWKTRDCASFAPVVVTTPGQTTTTTTNTTATASTGTVKFVAETQPTKFLTKGTPGVSLYKRKFIASGDVNIYEAKFIPKNTTQDKNPKYQLYLNGNLIAGFYGYTVNDAVNFDLYGTQKVLQGENTIEIIGDLSNYVSSDRFEFENDFIFTNSIGESSYVAVEGMPATGHVTVIEAPYAPSITVITPNGGETLVKGQTYRIKWDSKDAPQLYVSLMKDGVFYDGNSLNSAPIDNGYFDWTIPTTIPDGSNYKIQVSQGKGDPDQAVDESNAPFTITSPATKACTNWKVTAGGPQGGTYWEKLRDFSKHPDIDQYRIQWWNGNWSPWYTPTVGDTDTKINNDGSWRYLISYLQDHNWETIDCTDGQTNASITVVNPNNRITYAPGQQMDIMWNYSGINPSKTANISMLNQVTGESVFITNTAVVGTKSHPYTIPSTVPAGEYRLKIGVLSDDLKWDLALDTSDESFVIVAPVDDKSCTSTSTPSIKVLSPNGNEVYTIGETLNIKWEICNYSISNVDVILEDTTMASQGHPGVDGTVILQNLDPKSGSYKWVIPSTFTASPMTYLGNGKVYRINLGEGNASVPGNWDKSDGFFTINKQTAKITEKNIKTQGVTSAEQSASSSGQEISFTRRLVIGKKGDDVMLLQEILIDQGFLKANNPTGYYGPVTTRSVQKLQRANKIQATGAVGPATRALLNSIVEKMNEGGND